MTHLPCRKGFLFLWRNDNPCIKIYYRSKTVLMANNQFLGISSKETTSFEKNTLPKQLSMTFGLKRQCPTSVLNRQRLLCSCQVITSVHVHFAKGWFMKLPNERHVFQTTITNYDVIKWNDWSPNITIGSEGFFSVHKDQLSTRTRSGR